MPTRDPTPEQRARWDRQRTRRPHPLSLSAEEWQALRALSAARGAPVSRLVGAWALRAAARLAGRVGAMDDETPGPTEGPGS